MRSRSPSAPAAVRRLGAGTELSDRQLVERAGSGDAWAREVIYRRYVGVVTGVAARLLGDAREAEDVAHDAFVSAFEELDRLRAPDALRSWLVGIAVHRVHKRFRRRKLRRRLGLDRADTDLAKLIARPVAPELRAAMIDLGRVLERLRPGARTCWWLRYGEGYTLQEVADAHGCSLATAKRRIAAAQRVVTRTLRVEDPIP